MWILHKLPEYILCMTLWDWCRIIISLPYSHCIISTVATEPWIIIRVRCSSLSGNNCIIWCCPASCSFIHSSFKHIRHHPARFSIIYLLPPARWIIYYSPSCILYLGYTCNSSVLALISYCRIRTCHLLCWHTICEAAYGNRIVFFIHPYFMKSLIEKIWTASLRCKFL